MAQKLFKGFMQVTEGTFTAADGYIYFVRKTENTGATDGYLQFNGKKYGTAAEVAAVLEGKIGTLPNGYNNVVAYIQDQITGITGNFSGNTVSGESNGVEVHVGQANGNVTGVTVTAPNFAETYAPLSLTGSVETLSGSVVNIENDYLKSADKTELAGQVTAETAAREAAFAELSASTRLTALEESAHTHDNKSVLDGITAEKVNTWDSIAGGAEVVLSAYTGDNAGVTEGFLKSYEIFQGGVSKGKIDIPKDMVVTSGVITANTQNEKVLRLTIANQNEPVDILVSDLVDVYTAGDGIEISSANTVSAKVVAGNGLSVDSNGIAMGLADASNNGAMSSGDFTKLAGVESGAQVNIIEAVKVDGTALTITDKAVNIELPDYSETYAPLSLTGTVETNRTAFDNYTAATDSAINTVTGRVDTLESKHDTLSGRVDNIETGYTTNATYNAYTATTDGRLDVIESGYTQKSTYDTYTAATDSSIAALSGVSADTRLTALESLTASTDSALQSVSAGDASVTVGTKDGNKNQTVAVAVSSASDNALELKNDGLFAAIYYDGDDSE